MIKDAPELVIHDEEIPLSVLYQKILVAQGVILKCLYSYVNAILKLSAKDQGKIKDACEFLTRSLEEPEFYDA